MNKLLILVSLFLWFGEAQASRIMEIEDYYSKKVSDFVKTRYPRSAFSVYVKVDTEDKPQVRKVANNGPSLSLPYFETVDPKDVNFWDRKDLSLGTLISYLRNVFIKVDIDHQFSDAEMENFKAELFQHLKLSETYDRIEVKKRKWQGDSQWNQLKNYGLGGFLGIGLLGLLFFFIFQMGISKLIKGLSQPLSEIGRSAENVANSSQLTGPSASSFQLANQKFEESSVTLDQIEKVQAEILKISKYMSDPDSELIQKIEDLGAQDPAAMGAIFSFMPIEDLKSLIVWAKGEWWRSAITQITPVTQATLDFAAQLNHLYTRKNLLGTTVDKEIEGVKKVLARLSEKQFGELLENKKYEQAEIVLRLLPQDKMIVVGKYLYPGQWAQLLVAQTGQGAQFSELKPFKEKALKICPLKTEDEISEYFREADLLNLLDRSNTKDERDIYRALDDNSWIKKDRTPFYSIFQEEEAVLSTLATDLPLELWALVLTHCDRGECDTIYKHFTSRQAFVLREYKTRYKENPPQAWDVISSKKRILNSLYRLKMRFELQKDQERVNEVAA